MQSLPNSPRSTFSPKVGSWSKDIFQKIILSVARRFKNENLTFIWAYFTV